MLAFMSAISNFQHRFKQKISLPFVVGLRVVIIGLLVVRLVVVLLVVMIGLRVVVLLVVRLVVVVGFGVVVVVVVVDVVVVLVVVVVGGSVVVGFLFLFFFAACFFSRSFLFLSLSAAAAAFSALFRFTELFDTLTIGYDPQCYSKLLVREILRPLQTRASSTQHSLTCIGGYSL